MQQISLKLSENLHHELILKAQENEISLSDVMRECLVTGLKHFRLDVSLDDSRQSASTLQKKITTHTIFIYCLLEEFIKTKVDNGVVLFNKAESKAEKLILAMLQKSLKE